MLSISVRLPFVPLTGCAALRGGRRTRKTKSYKRYALSPYVIGSRRSICSRSPHTIGSCCTGALRLRAGGPGGDHGGCPEAAKGPPPRRAGPCRLHTGAHV
eukprot:801337-Prorocentrum_minimum.AAC.1